MTSRTPARDDRPHRGGAPAPDSTDAGGSEPSPEGARRRSDGQREAGRPRREPALLLLASLAIVAWGTLELLEPSAAAGSLDRAARGSFALGLLAFGAAALALLGAAPTAPPAAGNGVLERCLRMFFADAGGEESAREGAGGRGGERGPGSVTAPGRARLGWARMATGLGVLFLLAAALLALSAYAAAVLMALAGAAGVLVLRSA